VQEVVGGIDVEEKNGGQKEIQDQVVRRGLCTGCGACVGLCPYQASYEDRIVFLNRCDLKEGRCYAFCPRTPTDLEGLRKALFDKTDLTPEAGSTRGFYLARARDPRIRERAQHGGTVTALVELALKEGFINEAILTKAGEDLLPREINVNDPEKVPGSGKSRFVVSPILGSFNRLAANGQHKIGIVATPCQTLALAKMRLYSAKENRGPVDRLRLVIGLFCGWALSWQELRNLLQKKTTKAPILGMDILPSRYHSLEVYTRSGTIEVSLDEVTPCIRDACWGCFDMTAEFSDISVGSARLSEGWEEARHWNQVIVRSPAGERLFAVAKAKGILEFREVPEGNLERLKQAALNKKRAALRNLAERSGREDDLLYLDRRDPVFQGL
jgi:coenzyme F420 hydrogenase subunit beta